MAIDPARDIIVSEFVSLDGVVQRLREVGPAEARVELSGVPGLDLILDALKTTRGNRAKAARLLDTTERILNYKVRGYGIDVRRFKTPEVGRRGPSDALPEPARDVPVAASR